MVFAQAEKTKYMVMEVGIFIAHLGHFLNRALEAIVPPKKKNSWGHDFFEVLSTKPLTE